MLIQDCFLRVNSRNLRNTIVNSKCGSLSNEFCDTEMICNTGFFPTLKRTAQACEYGSSVIYYHSFTVPRQPAFMRRHSRRSGCRKEQSREVQGDVHVSRGTS